MHKHPMAYTPTVERPALIICPQCGEAYLHDGSVTEVGATFERTHGQGKCERPRDGIDRETTRAALEVLVKLTPTGVGH